MDDLSTVNLTLPWPPSVNRYWRRKGDRYFISAEGQQFRQRVNAMCFQSHQQFKDTDRLSIEILAYPPDKRRRDLDNVLKSLLDALQHAGIYHDDNQIDSIHIIRQKELLGEVSLCLSKMVFPNLQMNGHN
jgi:crossover junction endodeoxyribonuclease RusA